jgi:ABC-type glycerol-3-phosphate transport system substrate-binding protein
VFVLDTIMMELGGPAYYVKFFKGEVDVANDPIFKESLEKFAALQQYSNMRDHSSLTWDQAVGAVGAEQAAMTMMGTWAIGAFVKGSNWQPGVDFGAVNYPTKPERILLFHRYLRLHGCAPIRKNARMAVGCGFACCRSTDVQLAVRPHRHRPDGVP